MSSLLALAATFLDELTNPRYGRRRNEEVGLEFAEILSEDLVPRLAREVQALQSPNQLTVHGWRWVLGWSRANDVRLDDGLLLQLCEQWDSSTMKALVIEAAVGHQPTSAGSNSGPGLIDEIDNPWLRQLLQRAVRPVAGDEFDLRPDLDVERARVDGGNQHARTLLLALVLVDQPDTLDAAAALLRHPWGGHEDLALHFQSRLQSLDEDSRDVWLGRLAPDLNDSRGGQDQN